MRTSLRLAIALGLSVPLPGCATVGEAGGTVSTIVMNVRDTTRTACSVAGQAFGWTLVESVSTLDRAGPIYVEPDVNPSPE